MSAGHPGRYYAYVLLGLASSVALIPAVYGIMRRVHPRHARLGAVGGVLAFIGAALSLADWGGELVKVEMGALNPAYHQAMATLLKRFDSSPRIAVPLQLAGIGFLLGMILLAIALFRGRTAPGWVCIGLTAGTIGNLAGFATGPRKRRASREHGISRRPASGARRRIDGAARRLRSQRYRPRHYERRYHLCSVSVQHSRVARTRPRRLAAPGNRRPGSSFPEGSPPHLC